MTRRRKVAMAACGLMVLLLLVVVAGLWVVQSQWFYNKVRNRIVSTVEDATGGRVEIGSFQFDWKTLRAEVRGLVLHGTESSDKLPLFRASSIAVGLKLVSILKQDVDVQYLDVAEPQVALIVHPDGRTNVPAPRIPSKNQTSAMETILHLAVGRFSLRNGVFGVESHGSSPFDASGRNLEAQFSYELAGPRYRGNISLQPLDLQWPGHAAVPFGVTLSVVLERNRVGVTSAKLSTGETSVELAGAIEDLNAPRGSFQYNARVSLADIAKNFRVPELQRGIAQVNGSGTWPGGADFSATGTLHATGVDYRDSSIRLRDGRLDGAVKAGPNGVDVTGVRVAVAYVTDLNRMPGEGHIALIELRPHLLELRGITLAALGGTFRGEGTLRDFARYSVTGAIEGMQAKPVVAMYSQEPLPWDARASGPVHVQGSFRDKRELRASATLAVSPAPGSAPVQGQLAAEYDARAEVLDLHHSTLALPSSRAEFSGAFGRVMQAHLETRDLNDLLPILGANTTALPVKLRNGTAVFDGSITGKLDHPAFAGHLTATNFVVEDRPVDSLEGDVTASPENVHLQNATVAAKGIRAQFDAAVTLADWKTSDASQIFGHASLRDANLSDLLAYVEVKDAPVTGKVSASAEFTGTLGSPILNASIDASKGTIREEPFDRFTGRLFYRGNRAELASGQLVAGEKQVQVAASYQHAPGSFESGRLHFQVNTNAMPLEQVQTVQETRPGAKGIVQLSGTGDVDVLPGAQSAGSRYRVVALRADIAGRGLQLEGQQLGNIHLTATSEGQLLKTHLDADFANSVIRGDGSWRLEGDYPGTATATFSKLDFGQLRAWLAPSDSETPDRFVGSAEGELRIEGPALKPEQMTAELRLPKFELGPAPGTGAPQDFTLHNSGPIVARAANSVITIESARLIGRATDVTIGGRVLLNQPNPLDVRVNGKIDLAVVQDFNPDLTASGSVQTDATVRGSLSSPQVIGRMQFQKATFNVVDFPNGVSNAAGTVLFTENRATIQDFSGETGGGTISLSGFVTYAEDSLLFNLRAAAKQVRIRYPEGVSTVADANLNLTGTSERSQLSGTLTILRTAFNPQSDFSSLIANSAEPVRTPSARAGLLGGMNFDIQITTSPDIQFQSSLTQDLQIEANLRLKGTVSNPALLGRANITQGQVVFFGTRYNINQGSIAFFNPLKVEPILDIDLETKARGIDITLSVTGPLSKPILTPRSDPPLQFSEIVSLLATGRTPTSDPTLLAQQNIAPQSWQQSGASALLGQAIASPVAGRLQRFFGVSQLRIDPTLPGVENNPQARLTLEQQVTPNITFTYITNVTSSNPQVVRVEWAFSKQWSVVALREENGVFGLDFFYKKRF